VDLDQGLFADRDADSGHDDAGYSHSYSDDPIIDVEAEDIEDIVGDRDSMRAQTVVIPPPRISDRFNTETKFHDLSLSQLAVHSLWIADYLRQLGETEMADGDLDSIGRCADDLESAIMLMFQLAGGTRQELRQRYHEIKRLLQMRQQATVDLHRTQ
jgi:hypothetical protein